MKKITKTILIAALALFGLSNVANAQALFKDLNPGTGHSLPQSFINVNGVMYFVTLGNASPYTYALWKSDGTAPNTVLVKDSLITTNHGNNVSLMNMNNTLYFITSPTTTKTNLWKSDGTGTGTVLVDSLVSVSINGWDGARNFIVAGNKLFFQMDKGNGLELWVSDGTAAGTMQVIDLAPGIHPIYLTPYGGVQDKPMAALNGKVYFQGSTTSTQDNIELYVSDGTAAGTMLVQDIKPGINSSKPQNWVLYNSELYFTAEDANGGNIWKTDGTTTVAVTSTGAMAFDNPVVFKNAIYFGTGSDLWKSDGTALGTVLVTTSVSIIAGANANYLFASNFGYNFIRTDGTSVTAAFDSVGKSASFNVINNKMYSGSGLIGLWSSDGTAAGTTKLLPHTANPNYLFVFNNTLFFQSFGLGTGFELWSLYQGPVGINQLNNEQGIVVYPNPSTGVFTCITSTAVSEIRIYNVLGETVYAEKINSEKTEINLTHQPKGVYFYRLTDSTQTGKSGKIIVE